MDSVTVDASGAPKPPTTPPKGRGAVIWEIRTSRGQATITRRVAAGWAFPASDGSAVRRAWPPFLPDHPQVAASWPRSHGAGLLAARIRPPRAWLGMNPGPSASRTASPSPRDWPGARTRRFGRKEPARHGGAARGPGSCQAEPWRHDDDAVRLVWPPRRSRATPRPGHPDRGSVLMTHPRARSCGCPGGR